MLEFHGPDPWPMITKTSALPGPRHAAIAFLGIDAPAMLHLTAGDTLVVNASESAVKAHATSPEALLIFMRRGVEVFHDPSLHAKVLVVKTRAVVGSANASRTSQAAREAVVVSNDREFVGQARTFVEDLIADSIELNPAHVKHLQAMWDASTRPVDVPGVTPDSLSVTSTGRVFICQTMTTAAEPELQDRSARTRNSRVAPSSEYEMFAFDTDGKSSWRRGDYVILIGEKDEEATLNQVLESDLPTRDGGVASLLRVRTRCEATTLEVLEHEARAEGHSSIAATSRPLRLRDKADFLVARLGGPF